MNLAVCGNSQFRLVIVPLNYLGQLPTYQLGQAFVRLCLLSMIFSNCHFTWIEKITIIRR
jgi:hypothetical protein